MLFSSPPPSQEKEKVDPQVLVLKDDKPLATNFRKIRTQEDLKELDDKVEQILINKNEEETISSTTSASPWWHAWKWNVWKYLKSQNTSNFCVNLHPSLQAKLDRDPTLNPDTLYLVPVEETKSNTTWWRYIGSLFSNKLSDQYIVNNGTLFNPPEDVPAPFKVVKNYKQAKQSYTLASFRFTNMAEYFKNGKKKGETGESYTQKAINTFYNYLPL